MVLPEIGDPFSLLAKRWSEPFAPWAFRMGSSDSSTCDKMCGLQSQRDLERVARKTCHACVRGCVNELDVLAWLALTTSYKRQLPLFFLTYRQHIDIRAASEATWVRKMVTVHGTTHETGVKDEPDVATTILSYKRGKLSFLTKVLTDFSGTPSL